MRYFRNNVLVVLAIFSILISLGGTWLTLGKILPFSGYSGASGETTVLVGETIDITLSNSPVAFGSQDVSVANDTTDNNPDAFNISNDGSVYVNVTIYATDLWSLQTVPTPYFNVSCRNETWWNCDDAYSNHTSASNPIGSAASNIIAGLPFNESNNSARVDVSISVPLSEPAGAKSSTLTFTATKAFS